MRLLRRVRHPNIVHFFGVCVLPGASFGLILEWVQGTDLRGYTKRTKGWLYLQDPERPNPEPDEEDIKALPNHKAKLFLDVSTGMQFLHALKPVIIHRDLKPPNILVEMVASPPRAKITDFGISLMVRGNEGAGRAGTRNYMAPEVAGGRGYNTSADVFSFGCTCAYTLLGRLSDKAEEAKKELAEFMSKVQAPIPTVVLVSATFSENPDLRPTFTQLRAALEDWRGMEGANNSMGSMSMVSSSNMATFTTFGKTFVSL